MKQLEVKIMGQSYLLGCPEGGDERLLEAVGRVDTAMCRIRDAGKVKTRDRIAVLAALNLAFDQSETPAPPVSASTAPLAAQATRTEAPDASPQGGASAGEGSDHAALAALIARLDQALGNDGRLI